MTEQYLNTETFNLDDLLGGDYPLVTKEITLLSGENLSRGAVLGKVTASDKYRLSDAGASDGSETPVAILAKDTDATTQDTVTVAYLSGEFNERALTLGPGHSLSSVQEGLRDLNIYLKPSVAK